jgi:hypothetical protein
MGFNKRYFSMEMLANYHKGDRQLGIEKAIGKTEGFIFDSDDSQKVIELWSKGEKEQARKLLDDYVLRISAKISADN